MDDALIKMAKQAYRKAYQLKWKHDNRSKNKQYDVTLTLDEAKRVGDAAQKHRRSITRFLKESCIAYISKRYLVPDVFAVNAIRKELALNYDLLRGMFDDNFLPQEAGRIILERIEVLEQKVLSELHHPKMLEQLVVEVRSSDPVCFETLKQLIQNHDP
ncbi:hypothetical protein CJD36_004540 [Flavipsychrobacter stenotrophus]|uniref:Uncharacterized protein n=2 Tax=Flavipsychrobacter stenotrophus TaxID=2077091 RepID=A0A2S7T2E5_9BACT|nr:hypothetical protein CJD36_004540 [Flavipsychrobacter stenotrophus]